MTEDHPITTPRKLIEVALPLDAINAAAAREKQPGIGAHPRGLHLWWARRPQAVARAVIFSQLVHDPEDLWRCQNPGKKPNRQTKGHWTKARGRLFGIIEDLVKWENSTNEELLGQARDEIRKAWREACELNRNHPQAKELFDLNKMPGLHDPFAGGGAIPLEAQRLGLEASASDLNPVAVLINKAMIEIPPKFAGLPPVNPERQNDNSLIKGSWKGSHGLAEDVQYYGRSIQDEAVKRIGHLYPPIDVTKEMIRERPDLEPYEGQRLTIVAWMWSRTVKSPNPAFSHIDVPLTSTFILSSKRGKEAYVDPLLDKDGYKFTVKVGTPPAEAKTGTKVARGANFRCLMSQAAIPPDYIKAEAVAGRMGAKMVAIIAQGTRGRVYLSPTAEQEALANSANPGDAATAIHVPIANDPRPMTCLLYGMTHFDQLFTSRQLVALTTFSDLLRDVRESIRVDAVASGLPDDEQPLAATGVAAKAYAEAVTVYLAFAIDRLADYNSTIATWKPSGQQVMQTYKRQALPITWDFPESNVLGSSAICWTKAVKYSGDNLLAAAAGANVSGEATQSDAENQTLASGQFLSTDPPYYDNIGYADLSDFFYVWLRRSLRDVFPLLLATIAAPKSGELVVAAYRHANKQDAEQFFLAGMTQAMQNLAGQVHPSAPLTIYYAFKQTDTDGGGTNCTGWEAFLEAVNRAGLALTGTWPMRTELTNRMRGSDSNALASSIVLVCRPRAKDASTISRRQFIRELNSTLPLALDAMTRESEGLHSPVAPVDLSQAIIGPGMAVYSRYTAVLEADGEPMTVRTALQLINRFLAEDDFDKDTQFCLHWFEQYGWDEGVFGEADVLARAKATSVDGLAEAEVIESGAGKVRLLRWSEYPTDWDPATDSRTPIWEALHHLIRGLKQGGESSAGQILAGVQSQAEAARQLAYRLYTLCERKGWAEDAGAYNELITSWSGIETAAPQETQRELF